MSKALPGQDRWRDGQKPEPQVEHSFKHNISFMVLYRAFAIASEGVERKIPGHRPCGTRSADNDR